MKHPRLQLNKRAFWCGVAVLVLLRCGLTSFQQAYTWVGGAPLDDELMFRAAQAITAGEWLGAYDYLTLSKAMFFPVWLALLHVLHLPYLVSGAALWCAASLLAAFAFAPLWRNAEPGCGRVLTLGLFGALAFLPSGWAAYTLRVYRDNIFPALCLVFFAGMAGMALRAVFYTAKQKPLWPWLLAAGVGLACAYLDREDAGMFLLPFAGAATIIVLVVLVGKRRWLCCAAQAIPYAMLAAGVLTFCGLNYSHYGVFALSDFSEGSFAAAMGAMMRVDTDSDAPYLSVPADARAKIYEAVPELEPLAYWLEEDAQMENDFRDPGLNDYRAGSFYWAIRRAAQFEGIYDSAQTADAYWQNVADKINAACDAGTLPSRTDKRVATSQPIKAEYVGATLAETWKGFWHVLGFKYCRLVRLPALRFQQCRRGRGGHPLLQPLPEGCVCSDAGMDRRVQRGADGLRAVRGAVPVDTSFYESAQKTHGRNGGSVAAAVRHLRHCAAALCHDRLCRGVQLRHRHQHDVPGNGASAAGGVRVYRAVFVRTAHWEKEKG